MRTIKFRAWDKEKRKIRHGCDNLLIGLDGCLFWNFGYSCDVIGSQEKHLEYILMQFTGLKDKNGKNIYEGDIVKTEVFFQSEDQNVYINGAYVGEIRIIASKGTCLFNPIFKNYDGGDYKTNQYKPLVAYRSEIIGNIYENPELLKQ